MSDADGPRGIIVAHGTLAMGLVDATQTISGVADGVLVPISNQGKSPPVLQEELDRYLSQGDSIVFTDLPAGSCAMAARMCCRDRHDQAVVTGVNLPVLLDFVFNRHLPMDELVPRLLKKGIESMKSVPEYP